MSFGELITNVVKRFSCHSSCKLSEEQRLLTDFKKTLTLEEIDLIRQIILDKRNGDLIYTPI